MRPTNFNFWILLFAVAIAVSLGLARYIRADQKHAGSGTVKINGYEFRVEVADTPYKRLKGLGRHAPLSDNEGMLFVFPSYGRHSFWMKDMLFDLDIIWIKDDKVVHIEKNVSHKNLTSYAPQEEANYVLEINSGLTDKFNISLDSDVIIHKIPSTSPAKGI